MDASDLNNYDQNEEFSEEREEQNGAESSLELDASSLLAPNEPATAVEQFSGEEAEPLPNERAWYVVHCYSGYENKVRHNLEQRIDTMGMKDKIFDVVIPTQEEIE